jgi:hypothetical protein
MSRKTVIAGVKFQARRCHPKYLFEYIDVSHFLLDRTFKEKVRALVMCCAIVAMRQGKKFNKKDNIF